MAPLDFQGGAVDLTSGIGAGLSGLLKSGSNGPVLLEVRVTDSTYVIPKDPRIEPGGCCLRNPI